MKFKLEMAFDTADEMSAFMAKHNLVKAASAAGRVVDTTEDDAPAKPKKAAKAAPPAEEDDEKSGLDYATEVRPVIVKFTADFGREESSAVLGKFENMMTGEPVTKGQELSESDWQPALDAFAKKRKKLEAAAAAAADDD